MPYLPLLAAVLAASLVAAARAQPAPQRLHVVGGIAGLNLYSRHEEPFWTRELERRSGGRLTAQITPFDRAGIRGQEMLRLMQLGVVPFGTALLSASSIADPELGAADLAGLHGDMASMRRTVAAWRPHLQRSLRERYGLELLAIYTYPAQVLFCRQPLRGLSDIAGRRVRTSNPSQSDLVQALAATPVQVGMAEIRRQFDGGNIDCAITGTMSGNTIGLHEVTSHLYPSALSWGLSVFAANGAAWAALPEADRTLLQRELAQLEQTVWAESERETGEGIACNTGGDACRGGRKGRMVAVAQTPAEARRLRGIFADTVLVRWVQRCGESCARMWNETIAPVVGVRAR